MLGYKFSFQEYTKKARVKETKCSLKSSDFLLGADEHIRT